MASRGVGIPFVADVGPFLKGTGQVEDALDNVIDSLDGVAREGKRSADLIETSFEGMSEEVQAADRRLEQKFNAFFDSVEADSTSASDKMEREFKTAFDDVERDARHASSKIGRTIDDGLTGGAHGKATRSQAAGEIGSEFAQNIGEGISSGKVGIAGALDTVLGTIGGVLPALGPVGAVAGVGALVIGSVIAGLNSNAEAARAKAREIGASLYDAMQDGIVDATEKETALEKVLGVDNKADLLRKVQEISDRTGESVSEIYKKITGVSQETTEQIEKNIAAHTTFVAGSPNAGKAGGGARTQIDDVGLAYKDLLGYQDSYREGLADANHLIGTANSMLDETLAKWRKIDMANRIYANQNAANKVRANGSRYLSS